jgi:hypothetical protein
MIYKPNHFCPFDALRKIGTVETVAERWLRAAVVGCFLLCIVLSGAQ